MKEWRCDSKQWENDSTPEPQTAHCFKCAVPCAKYQIQFYCHWKGILLFPSFCICSLATNPLSDGRSLLLSFIFMSIPIKKNQNWLRYGYFVKAMVYSCISFLRSHIIVSTISSISTFGNINCNSRNYTTYCCSTWHWWRNDIVILSSKTMTALQSLKPLFTFDVLCPVPNTNTVLL